MRFLRCLAPVVAGAISLITPYVEARSQDNDRIGYLSLVEDPVINTPSHRVHSASHFDVTFYLHKRKQRIRLSLEPNEDILGDDSQVVFLDHDGSVARTEPIHRHHHRVFKGWSWVESEDGSWDRVGFARIVMQEDGPHPLFDGVFTVMHDHHHVLLRSKYMRTKHESDPHLEDTTKEYMIVFRDSDIGSQRHVDRKRSESPDDQCSADKLKYNADPNHSIFNQPIKRDPSSWGSVSLESLFGLTKRQSDYGGNGGVSNLQSTIGSTAGCPTTRKVALVGVVTDCSYTAGFDNEQDVRQNVISVVNSASQVYESAFSISLGLRNLTVSPKDCPGTPPTSTPWNVPCGDNQLNITERLNLFSSWRGKQQDSNAYWTLMSNCKTGSEVGLSWISKLCVNDVIGGSSTNDASVEAVSGANVVARTNTEWQVFAHESGHTFGAVHDCDVSLCKNPDNMSKSVCCPLTQNTCDAGGKYIMNPTSSSGVTRFSPCTIGNICSAMGRNTVKTDCLTNNRNVPTLSGSQCGNGIVEEGEQCDCGGEDSCGNNECCDAKTCKFKNNAVCDDANEDCCDKCQFAASSKVCRASTGACDPQEQCTGNSSTCPADKHSDDGTGCGTGLECASGQCTSRDQQCQTMMGDALGSNTTTSCDGSKCILSCRTPRDPSNFCTEMNQNFLDGTPCSGGGRCSNGICKGASVGKEISEWINTHKPLFIGLVAGIGGLIVLLILVSIIRRCMRPKSRRMPTMIRPGMGPGPQNHGWTAVPPTPRGWGNHAPPPFPPPAYGSTVAAQGRMPSMRYA